MKCVVLHCSCCIVVCFCVVLTKGITLSALVLSVAFRCKYFIWRRVSTKYFARCLDAFAVDMDEDDSFGISFHAYYFIGIFLKPMFCVQWTTEHSVHTTSGFLDNMGKKSKVWKLCVSQKILWKYYKHLDIHFYREKFFSSLFRNPFFFVMCRARNTFGQSWDKSQLAEEFSPAVTIHTPSYIQLAAAYRVTDVVDVPVI